MKLNIRAKSTLIALKKFKKRYGKNHISIGAMYNKEMPVNKFGLKSYTILYKKR